MYGCSSPHIVYGFLEIDNEKVITYEWLSENGLELYATELIRNTACEAVYGVEIGFEEPSEKTKTYFTELAKKYNLQEPDKHLVLSGDISWECHSEYTPEEN